MEWFVTRKAASNLPHADFATVYSRPRAVFNDQQPEKPFDTWDKSQDTAAALEHTCRREENDRRGGIFAAWKKAAADGPSHQVCNCMHGPITLTDSLKWICCICRHNIARDHC